jgi:chloramphenicol-sensitive protein RarD
LFAGTPAGSSFGHDLPTSALIAAAGAITAVPLLLFAIAARRMDFSALGMVQFTSPTVVFLLGLTMFGEPLDPLRLTSFAIIWAAIALFVWDLIAARRKSADQAPA